MGFLCASSSNWFFPGSRFQVPPPSLDPRQSFNFSSVSFRKSLQAQEEDAACCQSALSKISECLFSSCCDEGQGESQGSSRRGNGISHSDFLYLSPSLSRSRSRSFAFLLFACCCVLCSRRRRKRRRPTTKTASDPCRPEVTINEKRCRGPIGVREAQWESCIPELQAAGSFGVFSSCGES